MAAPAFVANGSGVTITTVDQAVGFPSHAINDLAILRVKSPNEAVTLSVPSGFTLLGTALGTGTPGAAGAAMLTIYYRFCESAAETPPTVAALASTRQQFAAISTYRGAYIGNPPIIGSRGVGTGTAVTMTGGVTTTANTRVLMTIADGIDANGARASAQANADLVGIAENFDNGSNTDIGGGWSSASGTKAVAGAYGTSSATLTSSTGYEWATIILSSLAEDASAVLTDVTPTDGAPLAATADVARFTKITFTMTLSGGLPMVFGFCGDDPAVHHTIYDGAAFSPMFEPFSSVVDNGGGEYDFEILPLGGWWDAPTVRAGAFTEAT
jgi:hypothetical protein